MIRTQRLTRDGDTFEPTVTGGDEPRSFICENCFQATDWATQVALNVILEFGPPRHVCDGCFRDFNIWMTPEKRAELISGQRVH